MLRALAVGMLVTSASLAPMALLAGCGSSEHIGTGQSSSSVEAGMLSLGSLCTTSPDCQSDFCLLLDQDAEAQNVPGLCSAVCSRNSDCGGNGICLGITGLDGGASGLDGGACYRACSTGSDCALGVPCIWQAGLDAGACETVKRSFCSDIANAATTTPCEACLATKCCIQVTACVEDVPCAQLDSCQGTSCTPLQSSGVTTAEQVAMCANTSCMSQCQ